MRFKEYLTESENVIPVLRIVTQFTQKVSLITLQGIKSILAFDLSEAGYKDVSFNEEKEFASHEYLVISITSEQFYNLNIGAANKIKEILDEAAQALGLSFFYYNILTNFNGIPSKPINNCDDVIIYIDKDVELKDLVGKIHQVKDLTIFFMKNWIGGILSVFDLTGYQDLRITFCDDGREKVYEIVTTHLLSPSPDKWDCQEELEKNKSTKPFASD
jgi:hypothetical protein